TKQWYQFTIARSLQQCRISRCRQLQSMSGITPLIFS
ncbi:hypothetical protein ACZ87_02563, partial [Candidatus Erwinia dacicola]